MACAQEHHPACFDDVTNTIREHGDIDFILWTRTGWDYADREAVLASQRRMMRVARQLGIPVVGYHLDIWWGLKRQTQVFTEPFFEVDLLITADGGNDPQWAEAGVNHLWMPPAISLGEAEVGIAVDDFLSPIAFVGSHNGDYHQEHRHRHELVDWLRRNFRRDCAFWPRPGQHAIRGRDLQNLYASVDVVVGDSCFAGTGLADYWSDRIPETLGRGGFLLHPNVTGLDRQFTLLEHDEPVTYDVGQIAIWDAFDWEGLGELIQWSLAISPDERRAIALRGREHVREHHTYERRMEQVVDALYERNLLR